MSDELSPRKDSAEEPEAGLVAFQRTRVFRGQLPPPEVLRAYEEILPGITARLWDEVEREAAHRRAAENQQIEASRSFMEKAVARLHEGQRLAFGLILLLGVAGTALALTGHDNVAGVVFGTTVLGIASIFVLGRTLQPGSSQTTKRTQPESSENDPLK